MTKGQQIQSWLISNPIEGFTSKTLAMRKFITDTNVEVTYAQFATVSSKMIAGDTIILPSANRNNPIAREARKMVSIAGINEKYDDSILTPFVSNTVIDQFYSVYGGILPATLTVVPGESGVGKTTVILDYLGKLKEANPEMRILFLSSEMNEIHMFKYAKRVNITGVEIVFLGEYARPDHILEDTVKEGWDIIFLDSLQDTINKIKECGGFTTGSAENWLLRLMDQSRNKGNDLQKYTAWIATMHMTKGENYAGSSNLKHMTDAMLMMRNGEVAGEKYMEFKKNRDGAVNQKLYFSVGDNGCTYHEKRFMDEQQNHRDVQNLQNAQAEGENEWDALLNSVNVNSEVEIPTETPKARILVGQTNETEELVSQE